MFSNPTRRALSWSLAVVLPVTLATASGLSGCYNRYDVVPTELVKLGNAQSAIVTGVTGSTYVHTGRHSGYVTPTYGTAKVVSEVKLVRADGGVIQVRGDADVEMRSGQRYVRFRSPVMAEIQGENLIVRGGNGGEAFPLRDIQRATVVEFAPGKTMLATMGITMGSVLVLGLIIAGAAAASD